MNELQVANFVTYKELIMIVLASSGLLTLIFTIISKLFDKASRVIIMDEIKKIDEKYQKEIKVMGEAVKTDIDDIKDDVTEMQMNYVHRFEEQKTLITDNKELCERNLSNVMITLERIETNIKHLIKEKE